MMPTSRLRHGRHHQPVADAAHGLNEQRIGGIALDLAAQPVDLHIDRAFAGAPPTPVSAMRGTVSPRLRRQQPQHVLLAVGEMDGLLAAPQFAASR